MPAQINATITQNISDRQLDIDSMILSMIFSMIFIQLNNEGDMSNTKHTPLHIISNHLSFSTMNVVFGVAVLMSIPN